MDTHEQAAPSKLQWVPQTQLWNQDCVLPQPVTSVPTRLVGWAVHDCLLTLYEATVTSKRVSRHLQATYTYALYNMYAHGSPAVCKTRRYY